MKRGGPPARRTPLRVKTPLERQTQLRRTSPVKAGTSGVKGKSAGGGASDPACGLARSSGHRLPTAVTATVKKRSGGICEIQLEGCRWWAIQRHHRITQKSGGRHGPAAARSDRASNLLDACSRCHDAVTGEPAWAQRWENGWCLRERWEPTQRPVRYRGRLSYLDDAGEVHEYEAHCA